MRLQIQLEAQADAAYDTTYHHKLRGRLWRALQNTRFDALHDDPNAIAFNYSNPFPWGDYTQGDNANILVASPHLGLLKELQYDVTNNPEFNIGDMPFQVTDAHIFDVDVGEPGTEGIIETGTGVAVTLEEDDWEQYGITHEYNADRISWTPDHSLGVFKEQIQQNAAWKAQTVFGDEYTEEAVHELFEEYDLLKTYSLTIPVTQDHERTLILSKWRFPYRVRSDEHRDMLNLLLDCGLGQRNSLGFGFLNIREEDD